MSKNEKGKRGERQFCRYLREHGYGAVRAEQVAGISTVDDSADVLTSLDDLVRFEVKNGYNDVSFWRAEFRDWIEKLVDETPDGKTGVLVWSPDYVGGWYFIFRLGRGGLAVCEGWDEFAEEFAWSMGYMNSNVIESYKVEDPSSWKTTGTFTSDE